MTSDQTVDSGSESRRGVVAQYLDGLSGLIGIIIFANYLGVSNLGKYYVFVAVSQLLASPTDGVSIYIEHMIGKSNEKSSISGILSFGVLLNIIIPLILGLVLGIIYYIIPIINSYASNLEILLLIGMTISYSVKFTLTSAYSGLGNPSNSIFISSGEGFLQTIFQIILLIQFNIAGLLLGTIIANSITIMYVLRKPVISISKPQIEFNHMINYTKWSTITYICRSIYDRLGTVLLVSILSSASVGIYQATMKIIESSRFVSDGICRSLMVKFSQCDDYPINDLNRLGGYASLISVPMIFGGYIIGEDLLSVLYNDPEYLMGYYILVGGSIYFAIKSHSIILNSALNGSGNPKYSTLSLLVGIITLVISGTISLYYMGLNGIVIALIVSEIVRILILVYGLYDSIGLLYKPYRTIYQIISSVIMMVAVYYIHNLNINPELLQVGISIFSGALIYSIVMVLIDKGVKDHILRYLNM